MSFSPLLQQLIDSLRCLPSVGPKSAQRMAFHLLERDPKGGRELAEVLVKAIEHIGHCERCSNLSEKPVCDLCESPSRDDGVLCVLESPVDVLAIEQTGSFRGRYFVLGGHLSPIDGIGPADLGLDKLMQRLSQGVVKELILATNPTVEGEATAHYITEQVKGLEQMTIKVSRIAHGVPVGGELEFVDGGTLAHALAGRRTLN